MRRAIFSKAPTYPPGRVLGPLIILKLKGIGLIHMEMLPLGIWHPKSQRLAAGSLQDMLSSCVAGKGGEGFWPQATPPPLAHCLRCGRKQLLPEAGGVWGP